MAYFFTPKSLFTSFFLFFLPIVHLSTLKAQVNGRLGTTCTSITVAAMPSDHYSQCWANTATTDCPNNDGQEMKCCKVQTPFFDYSVLMQPTYTLYDYYVYGPISQPQSSPTFVNLPHGNYSIKARYPVKTPCFAGDVNGIDYYKHTSGNTLTWFGKLGFYKEIFIDGNQAGNINGIVGATVPADIKYQITAKNGTPTSGFCAGEEPYLDDHSRNYNLYWIAIFENGGQNRWESTYWTKGNIPVNNNNSLLNLAELWRSNHPNWVFEPGLSYTVQFAIENSSCLNSSWNNLDQTFSIFPSNACRLVSEGDPIILSPNPANQSFHLSNFTTGEYPDSRLLIADVAGRIIHEVDANENEVDISGLPDGIYFINILQKGARIFSSKLAVSHY